MTYERANVARMSGYVYGEQPAEPGVVKLNTNENPYPPSPAVARALAQFDATTLRRYPPATADQLRGLAASRFGVDAKNVVVTNGGDEGLRLAVTTFAGPGDTFGTAKPSYSLYPVLAAVQDCALAEIPLDADWTPAEDFASRLNAAGARLTCLVNPHAPSGVLMSREAVSAIAEELDGVLVVDEAYVDFVDPALRHDLVPLMGEHENLLLLRTLSKGYALAGLRVGFLLGNASLIHPIVAKTRDSFNVDAIAQALACAALGDSAYAERRWEDIRRERDRVTEALRARDYLVPDSQANFVLVRLPGARDVFNRLRERGIFVRYFDQPRLADCLRVTVGTPEQNDKLLDAMDQITTGTRDDS